MPEGHAPQMPLRNLLARLASPTLSLHASKKAVGSDHKSRDDSFRSYTSSTKSNPALVTTHGNPTSAFAPTQDRIIRKEPCQATQNQKRSQKPSHESKHALARPSLSAKSSIRRRQFLHSPRKCLGVWLLISSPKTAKSDLRASKLVCFRAP